MMKAVFKYGIFLLVVSLALVGNTKADSVSAGGVTYTLTSGGSDGSGGFLVDLTIDTPGIDTPGPMGVIEGIGLQFTGATKVTFSFPGWLGLFDNSEAVPAGGLWWAYPGAQGCCGLPVRLEVTGTSVFTFVFDVAGLPSPPTETHIGNSISAPEPDAAALTIDSDVAITPVATPEPSSLTMLGLGLVAVAGFFLRSWLKT